MTPRVFRWRIPQQQQRKQRHHHHQQRTLDTEMTPRAQMDTFVLQIFHLCNNPTMTSEPQEDNVYSTFKKSRHI